MTGLWMQLVLACTRPRRYFRCLQTIFAQLSQHPLPVIGRQLTYLVVAGAFCRILASLGVQHVHAHFSTASTIALFCHYLTDISFSMAAHASDDIYSQPQLLHEKLRAARLIVAENQYNCRYLNLLSRYRYRDRLTFTYNGVEVTGKPLFCRQSQDVFHIVSVAALREFKGFPTLIQALSCVRRAGYDFRCTIVGKGIMHDLIKTMIAEEGLSGMVRLVGPLEHEQSLAVMRQGDLFILASEIFVSGIRDGIPTVCTEAMALGLPVISTYVSGIPELIQDGDTGLLVPERQPEALAKAIMRIMDGPALRERLARQGYAHVKQNFSVETTMPKLKQILTSLLE